MSPHGISQPAGGAEIYDAPEVASLQRAALVDGVMRFASHAAMIGVALVMPNILQALDKSLSRLDASLDKRARHREVLKTVYYMKANGYLAGDYEHGLQLTAKAKRRLGRTDLRRVAISPVPAWDGIWRIVLYDIPEKHRAGRQEFTRLLRSAGCFQLQKSAWITPFECRDDICTLTAACDIDKYVTYLEVAHLDNAIALLRRFQRKYPMVNFSQN